MLVVLDGAQVLRGLPGMPQVLRQGPRAGVYTIAIDDDERLLPEECATVVSCDREGGVRLHGGGLDPITGIRADLVSPSWAERLARALAPLRDVSRDDPSAALPDAVRLLDLLEVSLDPAALAERQGRTTRALIGVGPDGPFEVDLSRDGPHALVAGTTGAGKSELLQTLICSLAVANRPDEMTFVLIDYKGGAAFKECVRLPHTVGMVSDLDGHLTQRALSSLAAEIRRRERLLLDAGAKDIEDYQRARGATWVLGAGGVRRARGGGIFAAPVPEAAGSRKDLPPLPRLVLIIDEFAALVTELPDFVEGLVDIARRGRSLGIHLILATQRPGGVVTADIQANTSLRIALRVTDAAESTDVIDVPDAAHISRTTPGRCYVRAYWSARGRADGQDRRSHTASAWCGCGRRGGRSAGARPALAGARPPVARPARRPGGERHRPGPARRRAARRRARAAPAAEPVAASAARPGRPRRRARGLLRRPARWGRAVPAGSRGGAAAAVRHDRPAVGAGPPPAHAGHAARRPPADRGRRAQRAVERAADDRGLDRGRLPPPRTCTSTPSTAGRARCCRWSRCRTAGRSSPGTSSTGWSAC